MTIPMAWNSSVLLLSKLLLQAIAMAWYYTLLMTFLQSRSHGRGVSL